MKPLKRSRSVNRDQIVVFFLFPLLLVCFFHSSALATKPFQVGVVIPLTGTAADYGVAIKNCIDIAIHDRPELFTNIRFLYEDAAYDPKTAVTAQSKLLGEGVNLSLTWGVSFCKALAPIAESRKAPLVGICLDPTVAAGRHYVLRFKNTTDDMMSAQATYLLAHGAKRIGLLLADHPYLEETMEALQRNLKPGQTMTIVDRIPNSEMDLRTNIIKLERQKKNFDAIGVFLFAGQIPTFYRQARDLKFNIPTFGTDFFESISLIQASEGAMNEQVFASIEIKDDFVKRYRDLYHNESQLAFGAPAYEFALTVGELFNSVGGEIAANEVLSKFAAVKSREGIAAGPYHYVNDEKVGQSFQFPVVIKKINNEKFEIVH